MVYAFTKGTSIKIIGLGYILLQRDVRNGRVAFPQIAFRQIAFRQVA